MLSVSLYAHRFKAKARSITLRALVYKPIYRYKMIYRNVTNIYWEKQPN